MLVTSTLAALGLVLCQRALAASSDDWRKRTIYQVMTDRFALDDGSTTQTCNTNENGGIYCGGTWKGLINKLDYIQGMGFDAIWISPVTKQLEGNTPDGSAYHGYWQTDINQVNDHFGSEDDLKSLAAELHSRNMYLMIDIVVNHFAFHGSPDTVDYASFVPFNDKSYFHDYCAINYDDTSDMNQFQQCWMGDTTVPLPDLRTENQNVSSVWSQWIGNLVSKYDIDGLRIDSFMEVNTDFWGAFLTSAGIYSVGEVDNGDSGLVCSYQQYSAGVLNYATYFPLIAAFQSTQGSISNLANMINTVKSDCRDTSLLGTFSENHDQPRFAALNNDLALAQNVVAFTMLTDGIPIIYQGQEQHYNALGGTGVPYNREALWLSHYDTSAPLYQLIATLNRARKTAIADDGGYLTYRAYPVYSDSTNIALRKGSMIVVLSNVGSGGAAYTLNVPTGFATPTPMTELLTCDASLSTAGDGTLAVPMSAGVPRVYYPTASLDAQNGPCAGGRSRARRSRLLRRQGL